MGYRITKVWDVNGELVVADTIEDAIRTYHLYDSAEIRTVTAVSIGYDKIYDAIILDKQ